MSRSTSEVDIQRMAQQHGDYVEHRGWFYFADGALLGVETPFVQHPPTDDRAFRLARTKFLKLWQQHKQREFEEARSELLKQAKLAEQMGYNLADVGIDFDAERAEIRRLHKIAKDAQRELDEYTAPEREAAEDRARAVETSRIRNSAKASSLISELESL